MMVSVGPFETSRKLPKWVNGMLWSNSHNLWEHTHIPRSPFSPFSGFLFRKFVVCWKYSRMARQQTRPTVVCTFLAFFQMSFEPSPIHSFFEEVLSHYASQDHERQMSNWARFFSAFIQNWLSHKFHETLNIFWMILDALETLYCEVRQGHPALAQCSL